MKNIFEIMKEYGLEVPEDKKKDFEKTVLENYKTVSDYDTQAEKLKTTLETTYKEGSVNFSVEFKEFNAKTRYKR